MEEEALSKGLSSCPRSRSEVVTLFTVLGTVLAIHGGHFADASPRGGWHPPQRHVLACSAATGRLSGCASGDSAGLRAGLYA
eukprot:CAMPEP_0174708836 /NCGR_PEP_ID=MMETSP1094-20130205/10981_1 /TAXON_ID=156173 /ORGANISM="Chrysochromulina brevifilum, Strain UTEX LB 985" /LENGTH=81 /DNA_ID=CAMNT_0015907449 /DNA_START=259 /DNA_END=504 /DNA_ORIENTATION=-